jgi:hypothetical protein
MLRVAAEALAEQIAQADIEKGCVVSSFFNIVS